MSAAETPDAEAFEGMHEAERETLRALLGNPPGSHMDMPSWVNGACTALIAHRSVIAEAEKRGAVKALEDALAAIRAEYAAQQEYASRDHGAGPKAYFRAVTQGLGMARGILADRLASLRPDEQPGQDVAP